MHNVQKCQHAKDCMKKIYSRKDQTTSNRTPWRIWHTLAPGDVLRLTPTSDDTNCRALLQREVSSDTCQLSYSGVLSAVFARCLAYFCSP